ncbi:lytic murein transglycosylase [Methylobacterium planeticum]|uniref:Lytic murein transglycosylase n=1 Tax=Methylobacterium planeticum TaxID=2615211 RepID=A0A6N6MYH8_9HYPH|nr:lytic murein transglycosylase [Methylobacterium planeticum]KAB1074402.1 lytic murein transglycosylase [Methylobacterium planeticum]
MRPIPRRHRRRARLLLTLAVAGLGAAPVRAQTPPPDAAAPDEAAFRRCLGEVAPLAQARGISPATVSGQLDALSPDPGILAPARNQAEFVRPIWDYLDATVTPARVAQGQAKLAEWEPVLARIEAAYGVDRHILVGIWGVESTYGTVLEDPTIVRPVVRALATLACGDAERPAYWRDELLGALQILDEGRIAPERMTGSWAGAMGHTQFMPTTYLQHAVDFDGDGRRDIWGSVPDALASTANYLKVSGWRPGEGWGFEVRLPEGFDYALADEVTERSVADWLKLGLRPAGPAAAPEAPGGAVLVLPAGARGPAFLLLPNFRAILRYNTALAYALSVAHLSDRVRGEPAFAQAWPRGDRPLSTEERRQIQAHLAGRGFPVGGVDGKIGPKTRAAIRAYQASAGLVPDGYADASLLERIGAER